MTPVSSDPRLLALRQWLERLPPGLGVLPDTLRPASDDASFRRYFRVSCAAGAADPSLVLMDAPPGREDCGPFVRAAREMGAAGLSVPRVLQADLTQGFLLLEDLGDDTYLSCLGSGEADRLYGDACTALVRLQVASRPGVFPDYDRALLERELMLYPQWYIERHKGLTPDADLRRDLEHAFEVLLANALAQPRVFVHRDYHSRNLMRIEAERNPGVLDFQDAVFGPLTYDLVSLLRDAYIDWPEDRQIDWAIRYWEKARAAGLPVDDDFGMFYRDFEWMGVQRQLKVLGIFARLNHRDGKSRYLADLPRVLHYAITAARRYAALGPLVRVLETVEQSAPARAGYTF